MAIPAPSLPPGVTPDQAGRAWAWKWLQGQNNHRRAVRRKRHRTRLYKLGLVGRWASLCMPWRANEAPSAEELLSIVLGVKHYTSVGLLFEHDPLSADNADCLARYLERAYSDAQQLIVELREHARKRRAEKLLPGKRREKTG